MRPLALLLLAGLGGCTTMGLGSYVSPTLAEADAPTVAQAVVGFVNLREGPSAGPIAVDAPQGDTLLTPKIEAALRNAGYTVSPSGRRKLAYQVEPRAGGALVRLTLDGTRAARPYARAQDGALVPAGPYSVTLAEARR